MRATSLLTSVVDKCRDGYCKIATFQSSDRNFMVYRGFGYLHCRVLSDMQYEIETIEKELKKLDKWEAKREDPENRLVCKKNDDMFRDKKDFPPGFQAQFSRTRPQLLEDLRSKLLAYG
jgi:hypothetical protein